MANQLIDIRMEALKGMMTEQALDFLLILNPGMGNIDCWLFAQEHLPTPAPFNRNSAFLVSAEGEVLKLCQTTTHPTDRAQHPHFNEVGLDEILPGKNVGVVNLPHLKKNVRDYLAQICPNLELRDVTAQFELLKARKSATEISALTTAAAEYDRLFFAAGLMLRPERLEKEVVNEIRQRLAWQGADSETPAFHNMVELTSAPDGDQSAYEVMLWPGRRLCVGDRVNVTVRGYIKGFAATLGRSFVLGEASQEARNYWDLAVQTQDLAASLAKPGATLGQISDQVNQFLMQHGFSTDRSGWIHGLGTGLYESPRNVDATRDIPLVEGMVLSIGPAVKPEGKDPYRCTDAFVVTAQGALLLSHTPRILREL